VEGFIVARFTDRYPEAIKQMANWINEGKIKHRETIFEGFDSIPEAFSSLFHSQNIGKVVVKLE